MLVSIGTMTCTAQDWLTLQFISPVAAGQDPVDRFMCSLDCLRVVSTCSNPLPGDATDASTYCNPHSTPILQNFTAAGSTAAGDGRVLLAHFSGGDGLLQTSDCQVYRYYIYPSMNSSIYVPVSIYYVPAYLLIHFFIHISFFRIQLGRLRLPHSIIATTDPSRMLVWPVDAISFRSKRLTTLEMLGP